MYFAEHESNDYTLTVGVLASAILHVVLLILLLSHKSIIPAEPTIFEVSLEAFSPPLPRQVERVARKQIVSESEAPSATRPVETNRIAERDQETVKEQVKRGNEFAGATVGPSRPSAQERASQWKAKAPEPAPGSTSRTLSDLKLDQSTLLSDFASAPQKPLANVGGHGVQAFSRPAGSGALFHGTAGTSDFLPHLADGDITLLNAKASKFAVFVRRVAIQVFAQMRSQGWDTLSSSDIARITQNATVRAVLSPKGELMRVQLEGSSSSGRFDDVLQKAVQKGARDPNPPEAARAADGNFHFIFQARSWVQMVPNPRTFSSERRWLLLSTGLE